MAIVALGCLSAHGFAAVLVFDQDTNNGFAVTAANNLSAAVTVVTNGSDLDTALGAGEWDFVFVDAPANNEDWTALAAYVAGGGNVAMSFWNWDSEIPVLGPAFGFTGTSTFSLNGRTLTDTGNTSLFAGVTMPNSDWDDAWSDDGDGFALAAGSIAAATISGIADPAVIVANGGRTIAAFLIDEAGSTWNDDGSAVRLWENFGRSFTGGAAPVPVPAPLALMALGLLSLGCLGGRNRSVGYGVLRTT